MIVTARPRSSLAPSPARSETTDIVRVEIGGVGFALPLAAIATILSPSTMTAADSMTGWAGIVPSRSGEIPIADGRTIFGLDGPTTSDQRLLILRGSPATGLLVDTIHGATTVPSGDIEWLSPLFGPVEQLLTQSVAWNADGALDLVIDIPALRRHLHTSSDQTPLPASAAIAALFNHTPPGDRLELRLDDSDNRWLLPIDYVRHISEPRSPARLPRTSPTMLGLLSWRRGPIPRLDTARSLSLPESTPTTLIVIGPASQPDDALLALTITAVAGVALTITAPMLDLAELVRRLA